MTAVSRSQPVAADIRTLCKQAMSRLGQPESVDYAQDALDNALKLNDPTMLALAHGTLARSRQQSGELRPASIAWHESLDHAQNAGDATLEVRAHNGLGELSVSLGDYSEAFEHYRQAIDIASEHGLLADEGIPRNNVGDLHRKLGEPSEAFTHFERALVIFRKTKDQYMEAVTLNNLAGLYVEKGRAAAAGGDTERASAWYKSAATNVRYIREVGLKLGREDLAEIVYTSSAAIWQARGNYEQALSMLETHHSQSRRTFLRLNSPAASEGLAQTELQLALLLEQMNQTDRVKTLLCDALERATSGEVRSAAELALSRVEAAGGNFEAALEHHRRYTRLMLELHSAETKRESARFETKLQLERARREADRFKTQTRALEQEVTKLDELARLDGLTQAPNRRFFDETLKSMHAQIDIPLCLGLFDGDKFKSVNDTYGHATGDEVLRRLALITKSMLRQGDFHARYGGEEFVILFPGATLEAASAVCERLRQTIETHPWSEVHPELRVTASFGVCDRREHPQAMIETADAALYRAKLAGRNRVEIAPALAAINR